jgi:phage terminase large subunit-like protein
MFVFGNIYGWKHRDTGYRRFRKAYWQVGRKNAKSQSLACVGSYEMFAMTNGMAEVYCAATKRDQAKIIWHETRVMLDGCHELQGAYKVAYGKIEVPSSGAIMLPLSKEDRKTGDGLNPQCGIVDEYHAHDVPDIYDVLWTGMGARPQPLLMTITTAGYELSYPCYRIEYQYVSQILDPNSDVEADEYFVMINELDPDDNIRDEAVWAKANPILCSYPEGRDYLRQSLHEALDAPEKMRAFLTKNMNMWIDQRAAGYMPMDKWRACVVDKLPDLKGRECYVGVDLSARIDLTSVAFDIPFDDGKHIVLSHSFMPAETLSARAKQDKIPYELWAKQSWLTPTPGAVVDYDYVSSYITTRAEELGLIIREICYDPYNATQWAGEMAEQGYTMVEIRQGVRTLGEPTKHLRELVVSGKLLHDGSPVLSWAMGNAVTRVDHNGNIQLDKGKAIQRIDPAAALVNAHVRAMLHEHIAPPLDPNQYATPEFLTRLWG